MVDPWPAAFARQFAAALQMVRRAIEACPDRLWDDRSDGAPFWHLAYHTLYYTDLYLSESEQAFRPMEYHVPMSNYLPGDYKEYGGVVTTPEMPYSREQLLACADHCLAKCEEAFRALDDERAPERCGFWWYRLNVAEFLLNNLRHVQHHAGQLTWLLRRRAGIGIDWLGTRDNQPAPPTW